ncbi:helix-turn-helix domain-containing protein [Streptomyces sp. NPDC002659]|uniref:helix-turn-helix domain-containing protein n=1 Tax=Streptomyces sp. NPDC002659 TaxID=3364656 RepID=UPI00368BF683
MTAQGRPGTKSNRDALRHEMTAAGCSLAEIVMEMRVRFRMRPREAWRHARGWTLQETAERISACPGHAIAADASLVSKWEKWPGPSTRRPSLSVLVAIAAVLDCAVEDLLDLDDYRALPESDLRILRHRLPDAQSVEPHPPAAVAPDKDDVLAAADESAAWAQWAESTNVGEIALEQILTDVQTLAGAYLTGDAVELFGRARGLRDRVFRLIEGHQAPRLSADLYMSVGYLCGLLAWISSDLGNLRAADTQGRTAWLCAEMAGHAELHAWVASTRSRVAFWDGRLRDAINHARRGASYHPRGSVGALLACQEADAWSKLGAADETQAALRRAAAAREDSDAMDDIGGIFGCPPARQENYAAGAHLRIGAYRDALTEADSALGHLRAQPVHAYGTEAQVHITRAAALTGTDQPDGVMEALAPALAMPPEQRLEPITRRMQDLGQLLAGSRAATGSAAVAAQRALEEWCLDSAPRRLALSSGEGAA